MKRQLISGQRPRVRGADGRARLVGAGYVLTAEDISAGLVLEVSSGGGFGDREERITFRAPGTAIVSVECGDAHTYTETVVDEPCHV